MISSMTGYGRERAVIDGIDITAEIKAVNNKTLEVSVKLPRAYLFAEERIKPLISECGVIRGKVDVFITVDAPPSEGAQIVLDADYAGSYISALRNLRDSFDLPDDITVMNVARNSDIFTVSKPEDDLEKDWERIKTVLVAAVKKFETARAAEGERLIRDVEKKLGTIASLIDVIDANASVAASEYEERLYKRLKEVLADSGVSADEGRIVTECAIYADHVAIDEEIVRLHSHIKAFTDILNSSGAVGRTLDFWCQEMNREANTIGSKAQNADITSSVIAIKTELEKIREQIQNLQ